jgi:hypothetical protein
VIPAIRGALARTLDREASTRPAALLRIALATLLLVRFADQMVFRPDVDAVGAALILGYWVATLAMLVGWRAQLAAAASAMVLALAAARYATERNDWAHHHVYLLLASTFCIALTPCGRSYALDRWNALARAERTGLPPPLERGLVWAQHLIAVQLTAVYFWGAIDKCNAGWLSGGKLESQLLFYVFDSDPPALPGWGALVRVLSIATVALELGLAIGLWFPRARRWLIPAGVVFHVLIYVSLPVTIFSALSCVLYLSYLDPDRVHAAVDRMTGQSTDSRARG